MLGDYWASLLSFALFGLFHSLCAREAFKTGLARVTGEFFVTHFWRFLYCALSFYVLYHVIGPLHWGDHPGANVWIVEYPQWLWRSLIVAHLFSVGMLYVAFFQSDYLEFWGIRQMWRGIRALLGYPASSEMRLFGTHRLVVTGLYRWVRHPMLSGGLLFLLTSGPSQNNIVFTVMYFSYMLLGGWYEERRLIRLFGDEYRRYQQRVGAFVPLLPARGRPALR